jgi:C_GCAxxG_C_C family probable redox protein
VLRVGAVGAQRRPGSFMRVPRIATGFAAGIGRTGNLCGAFTGAVMGLGLALGRDSPIAVERAPHWYSNKMAKAFEEAEGSLTCPGILGLDIGDPNDYQTYRKRNTWGTVCKDLIKTATGIAYDILIEEKVVDGAAHTGA